MEDNERYQVLEIGATHEGARTAFDITMTNDPALLMSALYSAAANEDFYDAMASAVARHAANNGTTENLIRHIENVKRICRDDRSTVHKEYDILASRLPGKNAVS